MAHGVNGQKRDEWGGSGLLYKSLLTGHERPATSQSRRRAQSTGLRSQTRGLASKSPGSNPVSKSGSGSQATPVKRGTSLIGSRSRSVPGKTANSAHSSPSISRPRSPRSATDGRTLRNSSPGARASGASPRTPATRQHSRARKEPRAQSESEGGSGGASGGGGGGSSKSEWKLHRTAAGKVYYWNTKTRETKWTLPSPLRQARQRTPEEQEEVERRVREATPDMHSSAARIQGLVKMREARLEVRRRRQEKTRRSAPATPFRSPPTKAAPAARYTRAHTQDARAKPSGTFSRNSSTSTKSREGGSTRQSNVMRRTSTTTPRARATSPATSASTMERFRRSNSHTQPSGASTRASSTGARRSTSQRQSTSRTPRRAPSAPAPASRSASMSRKRAEAASPPKKAAPVPKTLDDPRYQEGGYLSVAAGHVLGGRYELLLLLGTGQSATVWLAADTQSNGAGSHQYVAIKITKCSKSVRCSSLHEVALLYYIANRSTVRAQGHETGSALLVSHFEHAGKFGRHVCMVFEVLGPTLDVLMAKTNFQGLGDLDLIADVTISILLGLDELAAMNVVHTDLKPENIMFSRPSVEARKAVAKYIDASADVGNITESPEDERSVKISDFGLSYLLRPQNDRHITGEPLSTPDLQLIFASNYTKGAIIQTREYRAPEIILGNDFFTQTDIWSLACIVYELLTGQFLFDPKTLPHVVDEPTMDMEHLAEIEAVLSTPPKEVSQGDGVYVEAYYKAETGRANFEPTTAKIGIAAAVRESVRSASPHKAEEDARLVTHFIESALTWQPQDRPSAADLLNHPWLKQRALSTCGARKTACKATRVWDV